MKDNTNYWLVAVGWEGKMALIKPPMFQKNTYSVPLVLKKTPHTGDIYTVDVLGAFLATGGVDNKVVVWNSVTGTVRQVHKMPRRDDNPNIYVTQVKFVQKTTPSTKSGTDAKEESVSWYDVD
jgi:hypothetical protein